MAGELENTGLRAIMDLSSWRGPAKDYLDNLKAMINDNKALDATIKSTAKELGVSDAEVKRAAASMANLSRQVEATARAQASFGRNLQQFGKGMSRYVTLPLVAAGGAAVKFAVDFEKNLSAIQSIGKQTTDELSALGDQFLAMSTDINVTSASAVELADVFFFLQGSGFQGAEAMRVLEVAAEAGQAGITDLQSATDALVFSLNAYGAGADQAQKFSDTLFRTVDLGIVEYSDLAGSIGLVTGQAASSGVSFTELSAAIATMSQTTKGAGRITRELNMLLTALNKPSEALNKIFLEATGETASWMLANRGLAATLKVVNDATGGSAEQIKALFGNVRSGRAVTNLIRGDMEVFNEMIVDMGNSSGAASEAAMINTNNTAAAFTNLKNSAIAAGIKMAEAYLPTINKITELLTNLATWVSNLTDTQRNLILSFGGILAVMGPMTSALGTGLEMFGNMTIAANTAGVSIGKYAAGFLGPAGMIAVAIAAVVALKALYDEGMKQKEIFIEMRHQTLLTAQSYEEYVDTVIEKTPPMVKVWHQIVLNMTGGLVDLKAESVENREEFERLQDTLQGLGSVTEEFAASLSEGNESMFETKKAAKEAADSVLELGTAAQQYAQRWGLEIPKVIEITEDMAKAWEAASDDITTVLTEMPAILEESEKAITKIVTDGEKERSGLRKDAASSQRTLVANHANELEALEKAYNEKKAELIANNDVKGLIALDAAYQKKRDKTIMDFNQSELDLKTTNTQKQLEMDRAHLEDLIEQRRANQLAIEEQKKKLGMTIWMAQLEEAMKDKVIDDGEKEILTTLSEAFGLNLDTQLQYNIDSLALTQALAEGNLSYAKIIANGWASLANQQGAAADDLQGQLDAMPSPEDIMDQFNFGGAFDAVGGAAASAAGATSQVDSATASLGKTVGDVTTSIEAAIAAFESLAGYETDPRLKQALTAIAGDIRDAVTILIRTWKDREDKDSGEAKHAAKFAERATVVMTMYGAAAEAFKAAAEYSKVSAQTLGDIADNISTVIRLVAQMSKEWKKDEIEGVAEFATQVGTILEPFKIMSDVSKATVDFSKVSKESIRAMTDNMLMMIGHLTWLYNNTPDVKRETLVFAEQIATILGPFKTISEVAKASIDFSKVSEKSIKEMTSNMKVMLGHFAWLYNNTPAIEEDMLEFAGQLSAILEPFGTMAEVAEKTKNFSKISKDSIKDMTDNMRVLLGHFNWLQNNTPEIEDDALVFAEAIGLITDTMGSVAENLGKLDGYAKVSETDMQTFINDLAALANMFDAPEIAKELLAKAVAFAEFMEPIASVVENGTEALTSLSEYSSEAVVGVEDFVDDLDDLSTRLLNRVPWIGQSSTDKLVAFAAAIAPVSSIVADGMGGLLELRDYSSAAIVGVEDFVDDINELTMRILYRVPWMGQSSTDKLIAFAAAIAPAAEIVSSGMDILSSLGDYSKATIPDVYDFIDDIRKIVGIIASNIKTPAQETLDALTEFNKAVSPATEIVKSGMEILGGLQEYSKQTLPDVFSFMRDIRSMVAAIAAQAKPPGPEIIEALTKFAEAIAPAADIVKGGMDILTSLKDISSPTAQDIYDFIESLKTIVGQLGKGLPPVSTDLIDALTNFSEAVGPAAEIVGKGVDALATLGEEYIVAPSEEALLIFIQGLKDILRILQDNLPTIEEDLMTELQAFADAIEPVGKIIKSGMEALLIPRVTVVPAEQSIISFMNALREIVLLIGENLPTISSELILELNRFSDAVDPAAGIVKNGIDALEAIGEYEADTANINKQIATLMARLMKLMRSLQRNLPEVSSGLIISITEFKEDIELIAGTMKAAIELLEQISGLEDLPTLEADLNAWSSAIIKTLNKLLQSMQTFLNRQPDLVAEEFREKAEEITENLTVALMLLGGFGSIEDTNTTGFAALASAIHDMSVRAISDLNYMNTSIRQVISAIAAIPRTVIVRFVSDNSAFIPPSTSSSTSGLPSFDRGGVVPGPVGRPQLAIVHGGETITPPATQTQYNSVTNSVSFNLEAHYARQQSEGSIRDDLALMQLMRETG